MSAEAVAALEALLARVQSRASEPRPARRALTGVKGAAASVAPTPGVGPSAVAPRAASSSAQSQRVALPGPDPVLMDEPFGTESIKAPPNPELAGGRGELSQGYEVQRPTPVAPSVSLADDDIEDYDDELIEVIEDSDPVGAAAPQSPAAHSGVPGYPQKGSPPDLVVAPSAGAPSLERYAPAAQSSERSVASPQVVARSAVSQAVDVVRTEGSPTQAPPDTFLAILDDSLAL